MRKFNKIPLTPSSGQCGRTRKRRQFQPRKEHCKVKVDRWCEPHHFKWNHAKETTVFPQRNAVKKEAGCSFFFQLSSRRASIRQYKMPTKSLSIQRQQVICAKNKDFLLPDLWDKPHSPPLAKAHSITRAGNSSRVPNWWRARYKTQLKLVTERFSTSLNSAWFYTAVPYPGISCFAFASLSPQREIYILQVNQGIKNADPIKPLGS